MISVHTSPLDQPGTGDAGGMNVYIRQVAEQLAARSIGVEVFTRATSSQLPPTVELVPGAIVHNIAAGPFEGLPKEDLPGQLCAITAGVLRTEASRREGWFDVIHSHYWLSGQVGWLAKERWGVPLVHTMHTMGRVKNAALAPGDRPEPSLRIIGEQQVVDAADRLVANTEIERAELITHYDAQPHLVDVALPGVDLQTFRPGDRAADRASHGIGADDLVVLFVGRIQPLKAPDVLVAAARHLVDDPAIAGRLSLIICGGPSGSGLAHPDALSELSAQLGVADVVRFLPPLGRERLRALYSSADLVAVPSHSESFGLVALEAQACGRPVVAANVGGLPTAVADGSSGRLVDGHDPETWARVIAGLLLDPAELARLAGGARAHAERFSWRATAESLLASYGRALRAPRDVLRVAG